MKADLLCGYDISGETHCQRFHSTRKGVEESYVDLVVGLRNLSSKWLRGCETREKVVEKIVVEPFIYRNVAISS